MPALVDLTGQRFNRWTVIRRGANDARGNARWETVCNCRARGTGLVYGHGLKTGHSRSCGCLRREAGRRTGNASRKHGHASRRAPSPEFCAWQNMKDRCHNPSHAAYRYYRGRGITVADEWRDNFTAFYAHIGPKPSPDHSLDRINNDGNYQPGNVRWATWSQQNKNRRPYKRRGA